jgi:hypothetical protein
MPEQKAAPPTSKKCSQAPLHPSLTLPDQGKGRWPSYNRILCPKPPWRVRFAGIGHKETIIGRPPRSATGPPLTLPGNREGDFYDYISCADFLRVSRRSRRCLLHFVSPSGDSACRVVVYGTSYSDPRALPKSGGGRDR